MESVTTITTTNVTVQLPLPFGQEVILLIIQLLLFMAFMLGLLVLMFKFFMPTMIKRLEHFSPLRKRVKRKSRKSQLLEHLKRFGVYHGLLDRSKVRELTEHEKEELK